MPLNSTRHSNTTHKVLRSTMLTYLVRSSISWWKMSFTMTTVWPSTWSCGVVSWESVCCVCSRKVGNVSDDRWEKFSFTKAFWKSTFRSLMRKTRYKCVVRSIVELMGRKKTIRTWKAFSNTEDGLIDCFTTIWDTVSTKLLCLLENK